MYQKLKNLKRKKIWSDFHFSNKYVLNPFLFRATALFLYTLKTLENYRFPNVFFFFFFLGGGGGGRKRRVAWNCLMRLHSRYASPVIAYDGRSVSRNVAILNILVHNVINLLYYIMNSEFMFVYTKINYWRCELMG